MNFDFFLKIIPKIQNAKLLGDEAHKKLAPKNRIDLIKELEDQIVNSKKASVLILFYPKYNKTHMVLIVRNVYEGVHSSQIAFPGGKVEFFDATHRATALRETYEEIGIPAEKIEIVKDFTSIFIPPSNFIVFPFLGYCSEELIFNIDTKEVFRIIEVPIELLLNDQILSTQVISNSYMDLIEVPGFKIDENFVWGATAMILSELKEVLQSVL